MLYTGLNDPSHLHHNAVAIPLGFRRRILHRLIPLGFLYLD